MYYQNQVNFMIKKTFLLYVPVRGGKHLFFSLKNHSDYICYILDKISSFGQMEIHIILMPVSIH